MKGKKEKERLEKLLNVFSTIVFIIAPITILLAVLNIFIIASAIVSKIVIALFVITVIAFCGMSLAYITWIWWR